MSTLSLLLETLEKYDKIHQTRAGTGYEALAVRRATYQYWRVTMDALDKRQIPRCPLY